MTKCLTGTRADPPWLDARSRVQALSPLPKPLGLASLRNEDACPASSRIAVARPDFTWKPTPGRSGMLSRCNPVHHDAADRNHAARLERVDLKYMARSMHSSSECRLNMPRPDRTATKGRFEATEAHGLLLFS